MGAFTLPANCDEMDYSAARAYFSMPLSLIHICRKGRIANAIRTVVKAGALRENRRVAVDII